MRKLPLLSITMATKNEGDNLPNRLAPMPSLMKSLSLK